jgi:hypothetical protein
MVSIAGMGEGVAKSPAIGVGSFEDDGAILAGSESQLPSLFF